jgi:hypothetical protein
VQATLVAAVTKIQLQRVNASAPEGREIGTKKQGQHGMHQGISNGSCQLVGAARYSLQ